MRELKGLKVEKIALHGYGIAHSANRTIFVPYTVPGDVVDIHLTEQRKDIAFGSVTRYVSRPDFTIKPSCDAFGPKAQCGGCDWLMTPYAKQLEWKQELIHGVFDTVIDPHLIQPIVPSPQETGYRNKAFFPVSSRKGRLIFGMYQSWTHSVVPHRACQIQMPIFDVIAQRIIMLAQKAGTQAYQEDSHGGNLRQIGFRSNSDGSQIVVVLVTKSSKLPFTQLLVKHLNTEFPQITGIVQNIQRRRTNVILGDEDKLLFGKPWITEDIRGLKFQVHYKSFLQVNSGTMDLIGKRLALILGSGKRVIDAYSGIGSIGLGLAAACKQLTLIEENPQAVEDARLNAEANKITNVSFYTGRTEIELGKLAHVRSGDKARFESIIVDPPRAGLDPEVIKAIAQANLNQVIYLSCNPMTLARDIKLLSAKGYQVKSLQPFDMFPQTWHIETLVELVKE